MRLSLVLNLAHGAIDYDESVDPTGDGQADARFYEVVAQAEAARLNPQSTRSELEQHKNALERIHTFVE